MRGVTMWPSECGPGPSEVFDRTLETASRPPVIWESDSFFCQQKSGGQCLVEQ